VDGLSICLPGIVKDTAFPYFEKEVNLPELYHKVLRGLGYTTGAWQYKSMSYI
jgi:hypothetical protein